MLALLSILILAAASVTLERLDRLVEARQLRNDQTTRALAAAKSALLGWAATYPDQHPPGPGPGYLPCPDIDDDGSPDTACPKGAFGRLPWRHLGLPDIRDASGERLWYGLSDNFRNNPAKFIPMNSETRGELRLDGVGDVVAILVAPGPSLTGQERGISPNLVANYLEGENSMPGNGAYVTAGGGEFNDRVLAITRPELMQVVEARVLSEIRRILRDYRFADWNPGRSFPWLSPYADPRAAAEFSGRVGVGAGHLPVHREGEGFTTGFSLRWSEIEGAVEEASGSVDEADLRAGSIDVSAARGRCVWRSARAVDCVGSASRSAGGGATRYYSVTVQIEAPRVAAITPPTRYAPRRRNLDFAGALPAGGRFEVSITDRVRLARASSSPAATTGSGRLRSAPGTTGRIRVEGVQYDLDLPGEVPAWLVNNEWHRFVYVAVAPPLQPGGDGSCPPGAGCGCVPGLSCLTLYRTESASSPVPALAMIAGGALAGQQRETGRLDAYFEGLNRLPEDRRFERRGRSPAFNDQARVISGGGS